VKPTELTSTSAARPACDAIFARVGGSFVPDPQDPGTAAARFLRERGLDRRFNPTNCWPVSDRSHTRDTTTKKESK
jgi:hypothetical protein